MFGASQCGEIYVWDVSAASNIDGTHDDEAMRDLTATISKDSVGLRLQRHSMVESGDSSTTGSLKHIRQDSPAICIYASPKDKNLVVSGHKVTCIHYFETKKYMLCTVLLYICNIHFELRILSYFAQ
jgi:hypothetical protein